MAGMMERFKSAIGIEDEYYDDYDNYEEDAVKEDVKDEKRDIDSTRSYEKQLSKRSSSLDSNKSSYEKRQIMIHEPLTYDDGPLIIDDILAGRVVVLNLEMLDMDKKRQVFDFVSGAIYALKGAVQKVTKDIFVIAPGNVEIDGKLKEEIKNKGFYQL